MREVSGWEGGREEGSKGDRSQLKVRRIAPQKRNIKEHEQKQIQGDGKYMVYSATTRTSNRSYLLGRNVKGYCSKINHPHIIHTRKHKEQACKTRYSHVVKMANAHVVTTGTCLATQYCTITWSFGPLGCQPTEP